MSSLRPLITITLLAFVGVILYMKINDTEPQLPSELAGQTSWSSEVEVGGDPAAVDLGASPAALPPATPGDEAPPYVPPATTAVAEAPPSDEAPAWTPADAPAAEATAAASTTNDAPVFAAPVTSTNAATAASSEVPAMPPLPDAGEDSATSNETTSMADKAKVAAVGAAAAAGAAAISQDSDDAPPFASSASAAANSPASESPVTPNDPFAAFPASTASTADVAATTTPARQGGAMFPEAMVAVQAALDRGELAQGLTLLSQWYGDPSLTSDETQQVETLLGQLAGSVIYEGPPAHRLEPAYIAQAGDTLASVAAKYNVSPELLAKINSLPSPVVLEPGQELKVVRGPFSALVDLSERRLTLLLDRRYAGKFDVDLDPSASVEEGEWTVSQKQLTPAAGGIYGQQTGAPTEDRSLVLANATNPAGQAAVLRGPTTNDPIAAQPKARVIGLRATDVADVFDILSEGSRVTIRR